MTKELFWLTLTAALTGLLWIPYILDRCMVRGLMGAMANPSRTDTPQCPGRSGSISRTPMRSTIWWCSRPLVLILDAVGRSTPATVAACAVYFWARLAHAVVYALGIPVARTLAFAVGFVAQVTLALAIFG